MAIASLYVKRGLSSRELSRQLANSKLTRDDCALLRPLAEKTLLSLDELQSLSKPRYVLISSLNKESKTRIGSLCRAFAPLPSLRVNNSNEGACEDNSPPFTPIPSSVRKAEFKVKSEVMALVAKYGIERIGFFTLTFEDNVQCHKEATKRLNSLVTGVLRERYAMCIRVSERHKEDSKAKGKWHFHFVVVCKEDIRRGFNHANYALNNQRLKECKYDKSNFKKRYGQKLPDGANKALRAEWAFWVATAKKYGFGRPELLPVRKTGEAIAAYVAKYISKGFKTRKPQDKGARLYSVIGGDKVCSSRFSFYSPKATQWRQKVAMWAASWSGVFARVAVSGGHQPIEMLTYDDLPHFFGSKWAWRYRDEILAMQSPF